MASKFRPILSLLLTFASIGVLTQEEGQEASTTTCGGTIHGDQGKIEYKHSRPYTANERCVWAITSAGSASITFTVESNGILQTTQDYLAVGYFNNSEYNNAASYKELILRHNSPRNIVTVPGPVAFLHFVSDKSIHGLGFIVSFSSESSEFPSPHHFSNRHHATEFGMIQYPQEGEEPKQSERLAFFIRPTAVVNLALKHFEGDCAPATRDYLTVYQRRNSYDRSSLQLMQQFCSSKRDKIPMWKVSPDTEIIITLQTNETRSSEVPLAFQFLWVPSN